MYNCPMKHAYLIIAHHEFDILNKLIQAIDDERNDIFIHFDKKVRNCPSLTTHYSNLYILEKELIFDGDIVRRLKRNIYCSKQPVYVVNTIIIIYFRGYTYP